MSDQSHPRPPERGACVAAGRMPLPVRDEAHVWYLRVTAWSSRADEVSGVLTEPERRRLARYRKPDDRRRRVVGRAGLRILLSAYLAKPPAALAISQVCPTCGAAHGPLQTPGLSVSMSYSHDVIAYGVAMFPIGIDVERITARSTTPDLWESLPTDAERRAFSRVPECDRGIASLTAWTIREALGKAVGTGLAASGSELHRRAVRLSTEWTIEGLAVLPGYVGTVAMASPARVRYLGWIEP